jgi:predicted aspartyl protease
MKTGKLRVAALLALAFALPAQAECEGLRRVASVDLGWTPDGNAVFAPVIIAGSTRLLILDTGAPNTLITYGTAKQLGLTIQQVHHAVAIPGGGISRDAAYASMTLGNLTNEKILFSVLNAGDEAAFPRPQSGLLGLDILSNFDVSIDFGTRKLELFDPHHCRGNILYWPERPVATIDFEMIHDNHIKLSILLDGHRENAYLDTGAARSAIIEHTAVRDFRLDLGSADTPQGGAVNSIGPKSWRHRFNSLRFNGVEVSNPLFSILPEKSARIEAPVLLGMDVLKHLHVYIAFGEQKIYVTPSAAQTQTATGAPSAPAN